MIARRTDIQSRGAHCCAHANNPHAPECDAHGLVWVHRDAWGTDARGLVETHRDASDDHDVPECDAHWLVLAHRDAWECDTHGLVLSHHDASNMIRMTSQCRTGVACGARDVEQIGRGVACGARCSMIWPVYAMIQAII